MPGSEAEQRAASQFHPTLAADPTGLTGVFRIAITGANQSVALPNTMKGAWLDLRHSNAGELQYGFALGAAGTVNMDEPAAIGAGDVNAGYPIPVGSEKPGRIPTHPDPAVIVYLTFRCAAAGGFLVGFVSERPAP